MQKHLRGSDDGAGGLRFQLQVANQHDFDLVFVLEDVVNSLAFSSDGRWLATGSQGGEVRLYLCSATRAPLLVYALEHSQPARAVMFSVAPAPLQWAANGPRWLATSTDDGHVRLFDLSGTRPRIAHTLGQAGSPSASALAFSPLGQYLAAGVDDGHVNLYRLGVSPPTLAFSLRDSTLPVLAVVISHDCRWLAAGGEDHLVRLYDLQASEPSLSFSLSVASLPIFSLSFSPDARWLAAGSGDGVARMYDLSGARPALTWGLGDTSDPVDSVAFSPDGVWAAVGKRHEGVRLYNVSDRPTMGAQLMSNTSGAQMLALAFSPLWLAVASGAGGGSVRVYAWPSPDHDLAVDMTRGMSMFSGSLLVVYLLASGFCGVRRPRHRFRFLLSSRRSRALAREMNLEMVEMSSARQSAISELPTHVVAEDELDSANEQNKSCAVCLEDFAAGDEQKTLPCFHRFHTPCVDRWLQLQGSCPVCRRRALSGGAIPAIHFDGHRDSSR